MRKLLAVVAVLVTAGCGSTVQVANSGTARVGEGGLAVPNSSSGTAAAGGPTASGSVGGNVTSLSNGAAAPGTSVGASGAAGQSASTTSNGAVPSAPTTGTPLTGRGWDAHTVYIGVITEKDTQQAYAAFGASNVDPGDQAGQATAVASDINAHGGILGRTVKLRFYDLKTLTTARDPTGTGQAACTYFTQDEPVIAVWNVNTQIDQVPAFRTCLAHAHVMLFTAAARAIDDKEMAELAPYYFHTIMVSWDALIPVFVGRLKAQGWLGGWNSALGRPDNSKTKIGVLVDSTPEGTHTAALLKAAFGKLGYPTYVYQYTDPSEGQQSSSFYFNSNGVNHVIVTDVELTAFQSYADSQHYHPRYGITTYNDPYSNLQSSGLTPTGDQNGEMGVGWAPTLDVSRDNSPPKTAGARHCLAVMAKGHQTFHQQYRLAEIYGMSACDTFYLIARGAQLGGGLTGAAIAAGIFRIGGSYSPANGFASALTRTYPFVQGMVRDLAWHTACTCFRYGPTSTRI